MLDFENDMKFKYLNNRLRLGLREDRAFSGVTTKQIPGYRTDRITAQIRAKASGIFCGSFAVRPLFKILDPNVKILKLARDGRLVKKGQVVAKIHGSVMALFSGERLCLNLLCRLSGIATLTKAYVNEARGTKAAILGTRKTTPLWRDVEKYAIRCGGGINHRLSLKDAVLIKDNHLSLLRAKKLTPAGVYGVGKQGVGGHPGVKFVEIEAKNYREVWDGIKMQADVIMLDNMDDGRLKGAITLIKAARRALGTKEPLIEVSGGVSVKDVRRLAKLGVDRISVGALTHSAPALDLSMEVVHGG